MSYREAIEFVLKNEGGYSNQDADRGGETFRGITRKYFGKWEGWEIIDETDHFDPRLDELVIKFYKEHFWDAMRLSEVTDKEVARVMLDLGVNMGKKAVIRKTQRILGVTIDGAIGPITIKALNAYPRNELILNLLLEALELYASIVNRDRTQKVFLLGWVNRIVHNYYEYLKNK